uniref:Uncharacterized protein n=1 Tax=Rhizophora mucronata TaxID=61149 RepID=A0A2P2PRC2_RHIMU
MLLHVCVLYVSDHGYDLHIKENEPPVYNGQVITCNSNM